MKAVDPDTAKQIIEGRSLPKIWQPPVVMNLASSTVQGAPSIVEMARALKNDPQLIYEFVYNNIEHAVGMGVMKGALGTLLDGFGNSFDQCSLLAALLRQAGFTANYEVGQIQITLDQAAAWLGCDNAYFTASSILSDAGVPNSFVGPFPTSQLLLSHCWLKVNIGTVMTPNWVVMDPSYKTYTTKSSINLATATGYSSATFLTQARSGYTIDSSGNWVQNVNRTNIRSQLSTLSMNLASWIKTNNPGAKLDDIIGGRQIVPVALPITFPATLATQAPGNVPTEFTGDFSTAYKVTFRIEYTIGGIDVTLTSDQLSGHRLTFFFTNSGANFVPVIALDGVTVATGTAQSANIVWSATLTTTHNAYPSTFADQAVAPFITGPNQGFVTGKDYYLIGTSFGLSGKGSFDYHTAQQLQNEFNAGGGGPTAVGEPALGERMAAQWANYLGQVTRVNDIIGQMTKTTFFNHHTVGLVGYGVYGTPTFSSFNIAGTMGGGALLDSTITNFPAAAIDTAMHGYALEMLAIQQLTGQNAISATRDLDLANTAGTKIWKGTPANWTSTVRPVVTGYSSNDLNNIDFFTGFGWDVLLPQNAGQTFDGHWTITGYALFDPNGAAIGVIEDSYAGGNGTGWWPPQPPFRGNGPQTPEPIDFQTGDYIYRHDDMKIGSGEHPYSLKFSSSYDSGARLINGPLGLGWSHNWAASARLSSDGLIGMGSQSPVNAVAAITELYVTIDLLTDAALPVDKLVMATLCNQWWVDQLTGNIVTVSMPDNRDLQYALLPDGTYSAPYNDSSTLTLVAGAYKLTTPQKAVYSFNTTGQLISIVYPYGVTITLTYVSGKLSTISNGLGRQLTLNYTGSLVTSVTDGTGRSVSYAFTSNQLTQFTDSLTHATTFSYDTPGRMTKYFRPANPTVAYVTNVYDTLSRVKTQANPRGQTWTYYFAGARSEEVDPLSASHILYFNGFGHPTRDINALGFKTDTVYDGRNRVTQITLPEGNNTQFTYDLMNNVLTETQVPKVGSGLSNIIKTWTYDATYNKKHTLVDGRGKTWTWNYDTSTGNLLSFVQPLIGGVNPTQSWTFNTRGQILTDTDPTSVVTKYTYSSTNETRLTQVVDFGVSPHLNLTTTYGYNTWGDVNSLTDPNLAITQHTFNNERRVIQKTDPAPFSYLTKFGYDANNNLTSLQRQVTSAPTFYTTSIVYSVTDKKHTTTDPMSFIETWDYDGKDRLQKYTDAQSRIWQYAYDALDRLFTVTNPSTVISETRLYSNNGFLASLKDANNHVTLYTRDGFDRLDKTTYADASFEENQVYDANNNVLTYRTRSGNTLVNTFDELNRLSTKTPTGQAVVTFSYDLAGRKTGSSTPVIAGNPATGNFQFFFDTAGRFFKETTPDSKSITLVLDGNGNTTKVTYPDSYFVTRVFDKLNRLTDIKLNGAATAAAHFDYDQLSRRTKLTFGNGAVVNHGYQSNDDMITLGQVFNGTTSVTFTYGFNNAHQENSRAVTDGSYLWHPASAGTITYGTANNVNEYPTVGAASYSYNGNANLSGDGVWTFGYDTENHLLTASKTGTSASYVYDGDHRQIQKAVGSVKTRFVYNGWQRIADYDGTANTLQNRYVYGVKLDEPLIQVSSGGVLTYLHADRLGSVIATTNSAGTVTNQSKYSPFGEGAPVGSTFGFTAQRYDSETGLYYYKRRYYSPAIGRFLQPDPLGYIICGCDGPAGSSCDNPGEETQLNLYSYVENDPLNHTDPSGLMPNNSNVSPVEAFFACYTWCAGQDYWVGCMLICLGS
jgi:RHS repeat-associated protein